MSDGQNRTPVMCVREMSEDVEGERRERMRREGEKNVRCLQLCSQVVQYSHCTHQLVHPGPLK